MQKFENVFKVVTILKRFTEIEGGDDRERRAALLDWDGDYSQFQGDEVRKYQKRKRERKNTNKEE